MLPHYNPKKPIENNYTQITNQNQYLFYSLFIFPQTLFFLRHIPGLFLTENEKGRAVYTAQDLNPQDIIEVCPVILIPSAQQIQIHESVLHDYYFIWPEGGIALALGYGSIYNHSSAPNAQVIFDIDAREIIIECTKAISGGDEILIDYTGGSKKTTLWFNAL